MTNKKAHWMQYLIIILNPEHAKFWGGLMVNSAFQVVICINCLFDGQMYVLTWQQSPVSS